MEEEPHDELQADQKSCICVPEQSNHNNKERCKLYWKTPLAKSLDSKKSSYIVFKILFFHTSSKTF